MEKVLRENSDHLFPEYNPAIPDAPLPEDPTRFSRFGRFKQVFESHCVDRQAGKCSLPGYVDLYYPNDHGGGAFDIHPGGPAWSYKRFVQDNDTASTMRRRPTCGTCLQRHPTLRRFTPRRSFIRKGHLRCGLMRAAHLTSSGRTRTK